MIDTEELVGKIVGVQDRLLTAIDNHIEELNTTALHPEKSVERSTVSSLQNLCDQIAEIESAESHTPQTKPLVQFNKEIKRLFEEITIETTDDELKLILRGVETQIKNIRKTLNSIHV